MASTQQTITIDVLDDGTFHITCRQGGKATCDETVDSPDEALEEVQELLGSPSGQDPDESQEGGEDDDSQGGQDQSGQPGGMAGSDADEQGGDSAGAGGVSGMGGSGKGGLPTMKDMWDQEAAKRQASQQ